MAKRAMTKRINEITANAVTDIDVLGSILDSNDDSRHTDAKTPLLGEEEKSDERDIESKPYDEMESDDEFSSINKTVALQPFPALINMPLPAVQWVRKYLLREPLLKRSEPFYSHPRLWMGRRFLQTKMWKEVRRLNHQFTNMYVRDIGANINRTEQYKHHCTVWGVMPMVLPHDDGRWKNAVNHTDKCRHKLDECNCVDGKIVCDVSTHTLYYISADDLAKNSCDKAQTGYHYAVVLAIDSIYGKFCDELEWTTGPDGLVKCNVQGSEQYVHPHQRYLYQPYTRLSDGRFLVREVVLSIDFHLLLRFSVTQTPCPPPLVASNWRNIADMRYREGIVYMHDKEDPLDAFWVNCNVTHAAIINEGLLLTIPGTTNVLIDRRCLASAVTYMNDRPRDASTFQDVSNKCKGLYHKVNMPPENLAQTVEFTALLAMTMRVNESTAGLLAMLNTWTTPFKVYNELLQFRNIRQLSYTTLLFLLVFCVIIIILVWVYDPTNIHVFAICLTLVLLVLLLVFFCILAAKNQHQADATKDWVRRTIHGAVSDKRGVMYPPPNLYPPSSAVPPLKPLANNTKVTVGADSKPRRTQHDVELMRHWGVTFTCCTPTYFASTQENELVAIRNRVTLPLEPVNWSVFDQYQEFCWKNLCAHGIFQSIKTPSGIKYVANPECSVSVHDEFRAFEQWVKKFPQAQQVIFRKARQEVQTLYSKSMVLNDNIWPNEWDTRSLFVKVEMAVGTRTVDGSNEKTPRAIQAGDPHVNVVVGPVAARLQHVMSSVYDVHNPRRVFAPGLNCEQLGSVVKRAEDTFGGPTKVVWLIQDFVKLDAHMRSVYRKAQIHRRLPLGITDLEAYVMEKEVPRGRSHHNVKYQADDGLCSGSSTTTLEGTEECANLTEFCLEHFVTRTDYIGIYGGDDSLVCVRLDAIKDMAHMKEHYPQIMLQLGFPIEFDLVNHLAKAEFYSKVFWPVVEGDVQTYVLGPKPGRQLPKIGFSLALPTRMNPPAVYTCLFHDGNHVPFLAEYLTYTKKFVSGQVKKGKDYDYMIHCAKQHQQCALTATFIHERYGLELSDVSEFVDQLKTISSVPCVLQSRVVERLYEIDAPTDGLFFGSISQN